MVLVAMRMVIVATLMWQWPARRFPRRGQRGQATTEYALVLLGVAAVAMALTTWVGGGKIASFLDTVFSRLLNGGK